MTVRDAVIPAGGTIDTAFAARIGTEYRALAPFGPQAVPVLQIVANALRESGAVGRIICIAPGDVQSHITGIDHWIDACADGPANIVRGLSAVNDSDAPAFVCASDLPLITPDAVQGFTALCDDDCDLSAGLITADAYGRAFPLSPPSVFTALRETGPVTLAGLFGVRPRVLLANEARLADVFAGRKSQMRLAGLLGPRLMYRWLTRSLGVQDITHRVSHILKCRVQTFNADFAPALACDMDTVDDYTYACKVYAARLVS